MSSNSTELRKFYSLGKRIAFLRECQIQIRRASKFSPHENQRDQELIDLDCKVDARCLDWEEALSKTIELEDEMLRAALALV